MRAPSPTPETFIWETHGIHVGTGADHVRHGVDDLDAVVRLALSRGFPSITFIIHTPRLTRFRYEAERATQVKFIRGDASYFGYGRAMEGIRAHYRNRIDIRFGVELEWMGRGLGQQWNRAKLFQAHGVDFAVGSVHFASNGLPYDGTKEETERLLRERGGPEGFWAAYFDELIAMVDAEGGMLSAVGHLDLPKLYAPLPPSLSEPTRSGGEASRRLFTLLEMIADRALSLDVNLSGLRKGVGIYPSLAILKRARQLSIPIAIGTDSHDLAEVGRDYAAGIEHVQDAGYRYYVSFSRGIPEKRPVGGRAGTPASGHAFRVLNLGIEMLNLRLARERRLELPRLSFGGGFLSLASHFPDSASLDRFHALRVRKGESSVTLSDAAPPSSPEEAACLFSHHADKPGVLSVLFNTLASEEINVETARLVTLEDGTATAYLTLDGPAGSVREAVDFVRGTSGDRFLRIEAEARMAFPPLRKAAVYLLEADGVWLPVPVTRHMVLTVHANRPGTLLVLLSALASRNVNVTDLQLGARGERGYAVLGVQGDERDVADVLTRLGPQYFEASQILLRGSLEEGG